MRKESSFSWYQKLIHVCEALVFAFSSFSYPLIFFISWVYDSGLRIPRCLSRLYLAKLHCLLLKRGSACCPDEMADEGACVPGDLGFFID